MTVRQGTRLHHWLPLLPTTAAFLLTFTLSAHAGPGNPLKGPDDRDGDGLTNTEEAALGTNPKKADTDKDGLPDGIEVHVTGTNPLDKDSDDDGISDKDEAALGTEGLSADTDDDGIDDIDEIHDGTDPKDADTDDDGTPDGEDDDPGEHDTHEFELTGQVTAVDGCNLTVSTTPSAIDASTATLEGAATCADLLNLMVEVKGEIVVGALVAKKVEVDD